VEVPLCQVTGDGSYDQWRPSPGTSGQPLEETEPDAWWL